MSNLNIESYFRSLHAYLSRPVFAEEDGASLAEYSLLLLLVALAALTALTQVGTTVAGFFGNFAAQY